MLESSADFGLGERGRGRFGIGTTGGNADAVGTANRVVAVVVATTAAVSCASSLAVLFWGLLREGPAFYSGGECRMTYSRFQFLPLRVPLPPSSSPSPSSLERYRLLKFTDSRDPRHWHLYRISGSMAENYESQWRSSKGPGGDGRDGLGRRLELEDNWCLLPRDALAGRPDGDRWRVAPRPHRGHAVLYVPGHWGSFSQSRSLGAHGTRWTGQYADAESEVYESLRTGEGINDGRISGRAKDAPWENVTEQILSASRKHLGGFVMDIFTLDFDGQGSALHASILLRQADFFARAVETIAEGCHLSDYARDGAGRRGITIVAHSVGAWVVQIALKLHPRLSKAGWIRNVVTLASPLGSIPYSVDAGVHSIARWLSSVPVEDGGVALVSLSGGLKDEMIPPELCEPSSAKDHIGGEDARLASATFLTSSIVQSTSPPGNGHYGMDHRAIVWCYDLLKVVRQVIFSLVLATDQGLVPAERINIAQEILWGSDRANDASNTVSYRQDVNNQHVRLLREKGYLRAVSIQLSAHYQLNLLIKLSIAASLIHTTAIIPILRYLRRGNHHLIPSGSMVDTCFDIALSQIIVPSLVLAAIWMRQLGWGPWQACYAQECQMLFGSIVALSQLATLVYFLIAYGLCTIVAFLCNKFSIPHNDCTGEKILITSNSFGEIFSGLCLQQLRLVTLAILPSTGLICFIIIAFLNDYSYFAWNETTFVSCCFMSLLFLILMHLFILACKPERRSEVFVLSLSLVKSTFGKVLHSFSSITHEGQKSLNLYHDFLSALVSDGWLTFGHHADLIVSFVTTLLPVFLAVVAFRTRDAMIQNSKLYWNKNTDESGTQGNSARMPGIKLGSFDGVTSSCRKSQIIDAIHAFFVCWYTWNVSVNSPADDFILPLHSLAVFAKTYLECIPFSPTFLDLFSAVMLDDLFLQRDKDGSHDKNK